MSARLRAGRQAALERKEQRGSFGSALFHFAKEI